MRISDWSSDVCSSDLGIVAQPVVLVVGDVDAAGEADAAVAHHDLSVRAHVDPGPGPDPAAARRMEPGELAAGGQQRREAAPARLRPTARVPQHPPPADRKLVAEGKIGSVRFCLGGSRHNYKNT